MPPSTNRLSDDERDLRLHAPKFFQELMDSRTATLMEENNPEALAAWKQELQQRDQLWQDMPQETPELLQQPLDKEHVKEALQSYAQEFSRLDPQGIDAQLFESNVADILQEQEAVGREVAAMKNQQDEVKQAIPISPPKMDPPSNS